MAYNAGNDEIFFFLALASIRSGEREALPPQGLWRVTLKDATNLKKF
jgi:hypothetical protein